MILKVSQVSHRGWFREIQVGFSRFFVSKIGSKMIELSISELLLIAFIESVKSFYRWAISIFSIWTNKSHRSNRHCSYLGPSPLSGVQIFLLELILPHVLLIFVAWTNIWAHHPINEEHVHLLCGLFRIKRIRTSSSCMWLMSKLVTELSFVVHSRFLRDCCDENSSKHNTHEKWSYREGASEIWNLLGSGKISKNAHQDAECSTPFTQFFAQFVTFILEALLNLARLHVLSNRLEHGQWSYEHGNWDQEQYNRKEFQAAAWECSFIIRAH